jgi:soluble lytic murein transglycosylase-like protein
VTGLLAFAMLSGCMATDPSLAPTASFSSEPSGSGEFAMALPETVTVLPTPSGRAETEVAYAMPVDLATASFAGSEPSARGTGPFPPAPQTSVAAKAGPFAAVEQRSAPNGNALLEPQPAALLPRIRPFQQPPVEGGGEAVNGLIEKYAELYEVPVEFVRRVVKRESNFNPGAYNRGHWGLMQIKHATARAMGYLGPAKGLLDAETNLKYAVRYLAGAWMVAAGNPDLADRLYQRGYYYDAKRMGLLEETGLGRDRVRRRGAV